MLGIEWEPGRGVIEAWDAPHLLRRVARTAIALRELSPVLVRVAGTAAL